MRLCQLLPQLDGRPVESITVVGQHITLEVAATTPAATCPRCGRTTDRAHSQYVRTLYDLPIGPHTVTLRVRVRRFRCRNKDCPQVIFAERTPRLGAVYARRTEGQKATLVAIGLSLGGAAGARLANCIGVPASRTTILRLVHGTCGPAGPTPRVLGVDDWARRRGQTYGTILVDLERHCPVALLPDRTAETLAQWLREHPGVEVIARDRAGAYADGARQGAPEAVQVADRFHLLANVGEALERVLQRKHACLKATALALDRVGRESDPVIANGDPAPAGPASPERTTAREQLKRDRRSRRLERYEAVRALHEQGYSLREVGRRLCISKNTVKRYLRAGRFPERAQRQLRPTLLTPFEGYLRDRWTAGCHNARTLWEEIRGQGFAGSAPLVRQFLARWRPSPGRSGPTPRRVAPEATTPTPPVREKTRVLSPRQARWLLLRKVDELQPEQRLYREHLLGADEELPTAKGLAEGFGGIVRSRDCPALEPWLREAENSGLGEFRQFALGLRRDLAAVKAALSCEWSNGQTEGQINRLKMLKRQMYGRASLRLLHRRFIRAA